MLQHVDPSDPREEDPKVHGTRADGRAVLHPDAVAAEERRGDAEPMRRNSTRGRKPLRESETPRELAPTRPGRIGRVDDGPLPDRRNL